MPSAQAFFERKNKNIVPNLEKYLADEGYDVEVSDLGNPAKTFLSYTWGGVLGLLFPMVRNLLVKSYVKGKKSSCRKCHT